MSAICEQQQPRVCLGIASQEADGNELPPLISTLETMEPEFIELERQMARPLEAHMRRWMLLRQISFETRHGIVDGVEIDLRHPLLPLGEWDLVWYFGGMAGADEGPALVFPWSMEDWGYLPRWGQKPAQVRAGDRIRVATVERVRFRETEFSHPADREYRAAYLAIDCGNRRRRTLVRPLPFWPPLSLSKPRLSGKPTFDRIAARVCDALGVADIDSYVLSDEVMRMTLTEAAFEAATSAKSDWNLLQEEIGKLDDEDRGRANLWLRGLVDHAVTLGYRAAQSEAEHYMEPRARRDLVRVNASGEGGRRSGETRRRRALQWKIRARALILDIVSEPGPHKREAIVHEVQTRWHWTDMSAPGERSLWGFLSELHEQGVISVSAG